MAQPLSLPHDPDTGQMTQTWGARSGAVEGPGCQLSCKLGTPSTNSPSKSLGAGRHMGSALPFQAKIRRSSQPGSSQPVCVSVQQLLLGVGTENAAGHPLLARRWRCWLRRVPVWEALRTEGEGAWVGPLQEAGLGWITQMGPYRVSAMVTAWGPGHDGKPALADRSQKWPEGVP